MQRPSFQFYPGDWQANKNLRRCTHHEKGVWIGVMCLLHDSEEYGILRWPVEELAQAANCSVDDLKSLRNKGVLKGADAGETCESYVYVPRSGRKNGPPVTLIEEQEGPIWYSSRFVRDEYVRSVRGEGTRFGAEPAETPTGSPSESPSDAPKPTIGARLDDAPKPPKSDGSSASSSSSSSSSNIDHHQEENRPSPEALNPPEQTPLQAVEHYLMGRMQAMSLGGTDYTAVMDWLQETGANVEVICKAIDAGLLVHQKDKPGTVPRSARFYSGYVDKQWSRYQAEVNNGGRATTGSATATPGETPGAGPGRAGPNARDSQPQRSPDPGFGFNSLTHRGGTGEPDVS